MGSRSGSGFSHQSTSPACNAAAAVAGSGITCHSTRSKFASLGPLVQSGVPAGTGTGPPPAAEAAAMAAFSAGVSSVLPSPFAP